MVNNLPVIPETWLWSPAQEDLLEKGMAFSRILVWRTAGTEATVPEVAESRTGLSHSHFHFHFGENTPIGFFFFFFFRFHRQIQYLSFSVWFISLSITPSKSIHVAANGKISFFFNAWAVGPCVYIYIPPLLYTFIY